MPSTACQRTILSLGIAASLFHVGLVSAQDSQPSQQSARAVDLDSIVVSASRIDRPGFDAPTPTVRISREELQIASRENVAASLNDLPQFRGTTTPQTTTTSVSNGSAPLDLRGLGSNRTLVLLNGRRFSSSNDLNTIPSILIGSVDVVTGGASAAWGSDAVAGVVNIGLDDSLIGTRINTHTGISSRSDNEKQYAAIASGAQFGDGRGHLLVGAEFLNSEGVIPRTDRSWLGRVSQVSGSEGTFYANDVGFANAARGGLITTGVLAGKAFNPDGSLRDFDYGTVYGTSMVGGEGPSGDEISSLVTPQRRYSLLGKISYDVSDSVRMTAELRHSRMYNSYPWFGDNNRGNGALTIGIDNAFLPGEVRDAMLAAGETSFRLGRFNDDFAFPDVDYERKTTQGTVAFDGYFGDNWRWSAYYSHGENDNNISAPGFLLTQNYANAVDSVIDPASGNPVCRVALADPNSRCVPIDLFGHGAPSAAAAAYVTDAPRRMTNTRLDVGGFDLRGEPFETAAGPVSVAVGIDLRQEKISQTVGELDLQNAFTTWSSSPMSGSVFVREAFGEVLVPLLQDRPFFRDLELNTAARISDYDSSGSVWSWKVGFTNEFFPGFKGRFTRSRDIRAANLTELFTTSTTGYTTISDPFTSSSVYTLVNGGGNPDLNPEEADTTTVGFVYSPPAMPGLSVSVDYFDIAIKNVITSVGAQQIATRCYNGNQDMCARISRDADGVITRILSSSVNLSEYHSDGVDIDAVYTMPAERLFSSLSGAFNFRLLGTWVHSLTTSDGISEIEYVTSQGLTGGSGVPRWRANAQAGYRGDVFGGHLRARYIAAGYYNKSLNLIDNRIGSLTYLDAGFNARLPTRGGSDIEVYLDVNNLLDRKGPLGAQATPYYDVIGRYFTLGARFNF